MGEGGEASFWSARWLSVECLRSTLNRLFLNLEQKSHKISDMGYWCEGVWICNLSWRRAWFQWVGISFKIRGRSNMLRMGGLESVMLIKPMLLGRFIVAYTLKEAHSRQSSTL